MTEHEETILDLGHELDEILNAPPDAPQKRRFTRISWRVPVICEHNGEVFAGHVADVGVGGVALEIDHALEPMSILSVQRETGHGPIRVKVRWCRPEENHFRAGTALADTQENLARSWLKAVLVELGVGPAVRDRRQQVRVVCRQGAQLRTELGLQPVQVVDVGMGGCQLQVEGELPLAGVELQVLGQAVPARVVWQSGPAAGLVFEALTPEQREVITGLLTGS